MLISPSGTSGRGLRCASSEIFDGEGRYFCDGREELVLQSNGNVVNVSAVWVDTGGVVVSSCGSRSAGKSDCFFRLGHLLVVEGVDLVMEYWWWWNSFTSRRIVL